MGPLLLDAGMPGGECDVALIIILDHAPAGDDVASLVIGLDLFFVRVVARRMCLEELLLNSMATDHSVLLLHGWLRLDG